jgi:hypothetical protein
LAAAFDVTATGVSFVDPALAGACFVGVLLGAAFLVLPLSPEADAEVGLPDLPAAADAVRVLFADVGLFAADRLAVADLLASAVAADRLVAVDFSFARVDVLPGVGAAFVRVSAFFAAAFGVLVVRFAALSGAADVLAAVFLAAERAAADEGAMGAFLDQRESPTCG